MTLEKTKELRKVEFIFTNGEVNPVCHCLYNIVIKEDGKEISRTNHRENGAVVDMKTMLNSAKEYVQVEPIGPGV